MAPHYRPPAAAMRNVERLIAEVPRATDNGYRGYWIDLTADTIEKREDRHIYAMCSPVTNWRYNSIQYAAVKNYPWTTFEELYAIMASTGAGLQYVRSHYLHDFILKARNPIAGPHILPSLDELAARGTSQRAWRNELAKGTHDKVRGMAHKAASFAMELCFPLECQVLSIDAHILGLYGVPKSRNVTPRLYEFIEDHWLEHCAINDFPSPVMVRHAIWDGLHGETSTRFWSYVFEPQEASALVGA